MTPRTVINAAYLYYYATTAAPACADLGDGSTVKEGAKKWTEETKEEREVLAQRLKELVGGALTMCQKVRSRLSLAEPGRRGLALFADAHPFAIPTARL